MFRADAEPSVRAFGDVWCRARPGLRFDVNAEGSGVRVEVEGSAGVSAETVFAVSSRAPELVEILPENLHRQVSLGELCEATDTSLRTLQRAFLKRTGMAGPYL